MHSQKNHAEVMQYRKHGAISGTVSSLYSNLSDNRPHRRVVTFQITILGKIVG